MKILMSLPDLSEHGGPVSHLPKLYNSLQKSKGICISSFTYGNRNFIINKQVSSFLISRILLTSYDIFKFCLILVYKNPEIIHLNSVFSYFGVARDLPYIIISKLFNKKIFIKTHGSNENAINSTSVFFRILRRLYFKYCDGIGLLSPTECKEFAVKFIDHENSFYTVKNIVEYDTQTNKNTIHEKYGFNIFIGGRLVKRKLFDQVLIAFSRLLKKYPNSKLCLCGEGPERGNLIGLIEELNINRQVEFLGWINNSMVRKQISKSDAVVFTSTGDEGMPMMIVETLASQTFLILSKVRFTESFNFDKLGCYILRNNSSQEIYHALETAMHQKLNTKNENSRKLFLDQFSIKSVTSQFIDIYHSILSI